MKKLKDQILATTIALSLLSGTSPATNAITPVAKPSTFCFNPMKVVKTKKYGKLKCLAYRTPRGMVWVWTRV